MYRWLLLFGVWFLYACFGLLATGLSPVVSLVESDLAISHTQMGTIMGAWQLTYIVSAIPCGALLDRVGSKLAMLIGALILAASAGLRGLAPDFVEMLLAVMLFGIGGPIISAGAPKVITAWFNGSERGLAMGIYMTGPAIGGIVSLTLTHPFLLPLLGDWQSVMFLHGGITLLAAMTWFVIASNPALGDSEAAARAEGGLPQGKVLRNLLTEPAVILVLLMSVGVFLFNHGLMNWLPELLRVSGLDLVTAGYWAAIPTAIGILGSLLIPRLATPGRRFMILALLSASAALASVLLQFPDNEALLLTGLLMQGIARSSLMTVLILSLVELPGVGERYAGVASGLFFSTAEVGGVLGPLSLGLLYDWTGTFAAGLAMLTMIAVGLIIASLVLERITARAH